MKEIIRKKLNELEDLKINMFQEDFLLTWEKSEDEIKATLVVAEILKLMHKENISTKIFKSGLAVSISVIIPLEPDLVLHRLPMLLD